MSLEFKLYTAEIAVNTYGRLQFTYKASKLNM